MSRSRVEIRDLYDDVAYGCDNDTYARVCQIEVVPRKMVEIIIGYCEQRAMANTRKPCTQNELYKVERYAEQLLKQFEEE